SLPGGASLNCCNSGSRPPEPITPTSQQRTHSCKKGRTMKINGSATVILTSVALALGSAPALASDEASEGALTGSALRSACAGLPAQSQLKAALTMARDDANGGFNLDMWGTVVNRDGVVCAVAFTGANRGSQWPGSRVISAQ